MTFLHLIVIMCSNIKRMLYDPFLFFPWHHLTLSLTDNVSRPLSSYHTPLSSYHTSLIIPHTSLADDVLVPLTLLTTAPSRPCEESGLRICPFPLNTEGRVTINNCEACPGFCFVLQLEDQDGGMLGWTKLYAFQDNMLAAGTVFLLKNSVLTLKNSVLAPYQSQPNTPCSITHRKMAISAASCPRCSHHQVLEHPSPRYFNPSPRYFNPPSQVLHPTPLSQVL